MLYLILRSKVSLNMNLVQFKMCHVNSTQFCVDTFVVLDGTKINLGVLRNLYFMSYMLNGVRLHPSLHLRQYMISETHKPPIQWLS